MSGRILMATVAALALTAPAAAQDQPKPPDTKQETTQQHDNRPWDTDQLHDRSPQQPGVNLASTSSHIAFAR